MHLCVIFHDFSLTVKGERGSGIDGVQICYLPRSIKICTT